MNTYSQGLTVILEQDIDLSDMVRYRFPFCGTFDGNHHTITGYDSRGEVLTVDCFAISNPGAVLCTA